ncbi:MAG TPA: hypothetical protein VMD74_00485, partial [Candidatus Methylomirabilis sp.]|nr:hypothetical protein [Candidatus Methylomirabilis sp.]
GVVPAGLSQDDALALAKKNKDPLPCFKITKGGNAQLCVELLAQFLQDGNVCADITDAEVKASCVGRAVFEKAVSGGDLALCAQISDATLDQACLQKIIDAKKFTAADCVALPDKEKNYCTGYLAYLADNALFASAKSKSDCQKISDSTIKQFCLDKQL